MRGDPVSGSDDLRNSVGFGRRERACGFHTHHFIARLEAAHHRPLQMMRARPRTMIQTPLEAMPSPILLSVQPRDHAIHPKGSRLKLANMVPATRQAFLSTGGLLDDAG